MLTFPSTRRKTLTILSSGKVEPEERDVVLSRPEMAYGSVRCSAASLSKTQYREGQFPQIDLFIVPTKYQALSDLVMMVSCHLEQFIPFTIPMDSSSLNVQDYFPRVVF